LARVDVALLAEPRPPLVGHVALGEVGLSSGVDAERKRADEGALAPVGDAPAGAVHAGVGRGVHTVEEVPAVRVGVKAHEVVREQAVQQGLVLRAGPEHVPRGPRDVPEVREKGVRTLLADRPWGQREVIVLEPDHGVGSRAVGRVENRVGEVGVGVAVLPPELVTRGHLRRVEVTQRPEHLIAVPAVVALDLLVGQPDAPEIVSGVLRRDRNGVVRADDLSVGVAVAPRDPRPSGGLHHGVERGGETARGPVDGYLAVLAGVTVRFAVRCHDEFAVVAEFGDCLGGRFCCRPCRVRVHPELVSRLPDGPTGRLRWPVVRPR
jgi:hypothetical protein